ncbi:MAG: hypothetical protein K0S28_175 [Paucimonas sp.]|jgi:hypothetical protein|nr:hypothetical protein [Paucimonas sp.]
MRRSILLLSLVLAGCATTRDRGVLIETASKGQPLTGATCTVKTSSLATTVTTPATIPPLTGSGDLQVVCDKPGYRTSEFLFRPSGRSGSSMGLGLGGGGGRVGVGVGLNFPLGSIKADYPSHVTVEMNPQ